MILEVSLHAKTGEIVPVDPHQEFVDFPERDLTAEWTTLAKVTMWTESPIAPVVAGLNRKTAIETYPDLARAITYVSALHPEWIDARRQLETIAPWSRRWPEARWRVYGSEHVPTGQARGAAYVMFATLPRFSPSSLPGDPLVRGLRLIPDAAEFEIPDAALDVVEDEMRDIWGAALLQREIRIQPTGGGTRAKNRKKPPKAGDLPLTGSAGFDETKREVLSVRVDSTAKEALVASGVGRELIEALGLAIASGRSIDEVRAALGRSA